MKKVVVLSGSIRNGRISHYVAQTVVKSLEKNESVDTVLLDLKEYPFPMLVDRITSFPGKLQYFIDTLESADGIIIVTPEYKNSIPGPLKNLLDHLPYIGTLKKMFNHRDFFIDQVLNKGHYETI